MLDKIDSPKPQPIYNVNNVPDDIQAYIKQASIRERIELILYVIESIF